MSGRFSVWIMWTGNCRDVLRSAETFQSLAPFSSFMLGLHIYICNMFIQYIYTYIYWINTDTMINDASVTIKMQEGRRKKTSLTTYLPLTLFVRFEKGYSRLHVRGCWRPNINFIFWPHCYYRHVVSFLFSWCWGPLHRGFSEGPLGRVWPSLPHLVSTVWNSAGNCFGTQLNSII